MAENNDNVVKVASPIAKFLIGMLAGCSAIAIPRLSSYLGTGGTEDFSYFPINYIIAIIAFSIFLGLVISITEYKIPRPPKETFFAALAIPGLIAGSLNTVIESNDANQTYQELSRLTEEVRSGNDIQIKSIESLEIIPLSFLNPETNNESSTFSFQLIKSAHAADSSSLIKKNSSLNLSVQREAAVYAISIDHFDSKDDAIAKAKSLQSKLPTVTLIKTGDGYEILSSNKILTETQATIEAVQIKQKLGITPKILKVK